MLYSERLRSSEGANRRVATKLLIDSTAWRKLMLYVNLSGCNEINGFGYVNTLPSGDFQVVNEDDIFITRQTVTGGTAYADGRTFARAVDQASQTGRADQLRLQWHSHVDGVAFFSPTDTGTIDSYGPAGMEWFISLVMNKHAEVSARLDIYRPLRATVYLDVVVFEPADDSLANAIREDIATKVTVKPLPVIKAAAPKAQFVVPPVAPAAVSTNVVATVAAPVIVS